MVKSKPDQENDALLVVQRMKVLRWRERECRFDIRYKSEPVFTNGEVMIDSLNNVEDTKGNNGVPGRLIVTNLRIIWYSYKNLQTNISIGFRAIFPNGLRRDYVQSRLRGRAQALIVSARNETPNAPTSRATTRYQFVFTNLVEGSPRLFTTIQAVFKAYDTTRLYREWKIRTALSVDNVLQLLPDEQIEEEISGVMNISGADSAMLGTLTWTTVRVVWINSTNELHNFSLPFLQMDRISVENTKYGDLLVIRVHADSGGHVLGLRIGASTMCEVVSIAERLNKTFKDYAVSPEFGIRYSQQVPPALEEMNIPVQDDDIEIIDEGDNQDAFAAYYADLTEGNGTDNGHFRQPVYSEELGLAIEDLRSNLTIEKLWRVQ